MKWYKKAIGLATLALASLTFSPKKVEACASAKPLGMGGTNIAVADTASAVYWNPAGLVQLERPEIDLTINPTGKYGIFTCYAQPLNKDSAIGINFNNKLYETLEELHYRLSYSGRLSENLSIGTTLCFRDTYEINNDAKREYQFSELTSDIGLLYKPNDRIKLGLLLQHWNRDTGANIRPGISFKLDDKTVLAFEGYDVARRFTYINPDDGESASHRHLRCGLERKLNDAISIRGGLRFKEYGSVELAGIKIGGSAGISYRKDDTETSITITGNDLMVTLNKMF